MKLMIVLTTVVLSIGAIASQNINHKVFSSSLGSFVIVNPSEIYFVENDTVYELSHTRLRFKNRHQGFSTIILDSRDPYVLAISLRLNELADEANLFYRDRQVASFKLLNNNWSRSLAEKITGRKPTIQYVKQSLFLGWALQIKDGTEILIAFNPEAPDAVFVKGKNETAYTDHKVVRETPPNASFPGKTILDNGWVLYSPWPGSDQPLGVKYSSNSKIVTGLKIPKTEVSQQTLEDLGITLEAQIEFPLYDYINKKLLTGVSK